MPSPRRCRTGFARCRRPSGSSATGSGSRTRACPRPDPSATPTWPRSGQMATTCSMHWTALTCPRVCESCRRSRCCVGCGRGTSSETRPARTVVHRQACGCGRCRAVAPATVWNHPTTSTPASAPKPTRAGRGTWSTRSERNRPSSCGGPSRPGGGLRSGMTWRTSRLSS